MLLGEVFDSRRDIHGMAEDCVLQPALVADRTDHDLPVVDSDAYSYAGLASAMP